MTYRLDSDYDWPYLEVALKNRTVVGPSRNMQWINHNDMKPIKTWLRNKLKKKHKAIAWFVSNCGPKSRDKFARQLQNELKRHNLTLDIYGRCGPLRCSNTEGNNLLQDVYFFYLAFENSFSEDYVTEKLLRALQNDAVPIILGGDNYSNFLPSGSYLDARRLAPAELAATTARLLEDRAQYEDMYRYLLALCGAVEQRASAAGDQSLQTL